MFWIFRIFLQSTNLLQLYENLQSNNYCRSPIYYASHETSINSNRLKIHPSIRFMTDKFPSYDSKNDTFPHKLQSFDPNDIYPL